MHLTQSHKNTIIKKIREKNVRHDQLARAVGKSSPWVSKLLKPAEKGGLQTIKSSDADKIDEFLDFSLLAVQTSWSPFPEVLTKFAVAAQENAVLYNVAEALLAAHQAYAPPYIETEDMSKVGKDIYELATNLDRCEDGSLKYGKLARQVLQVLTQVSH